MYHQEFNEDIRKIATSIEDETNQIISRNDLIIAIINQIDKYIQHMDDQIYMDEYIKKSFIIGKYVELYKNNQLFKAKVLSITKNGELQVIINNEVQIVSSGEITRMVITNE